MSQTHRSPPATSVPVAGTAAFSKFIAVLQLIADAEAPPTIGTLSLDSGYPRPTVHRIVAALLAEGLIAMTAQGNTYILGARLVNLASRSWERSDLRLASVEALAELRDATSETVHLAVPSDLGMVYIEKLESPHAVRMASRIGTRVALTSSSVGKAYLASLPVRERDSLLAQAPFDRFTDHTITDIDILRDELELTAQRGYSEDREENELAIFCYGAPIPGADKRAVGCVSISMPVYRHEASNHQSYTEPLKLACQKIAALLGPAFL
jgi:IclR family KDG regulon transcriptional repressor